MIQVNDGLSALFRKHRNQTLLPYAYDSKPKKGFKKPQTDYEQFLMKYEDLETEAEHLTDKDLLFYFQEAARQSGFKYVIANWGRDLALTQRARQNYPNRELCLMIEFLFFSEQDYLKKETLSPTILVSTWCNTIYRDSLLWAEDKYAPKKYGRPVSKKAVREWTGAEKKSAVGKWRG
jgi:hypothetical protein